MRLVLAYLSQLETTHSVQDVSGDPAYEKRGIDIVLTRQDGSQTTIDVKGDRYPEVNFFFETWSVREENIPGCFLTSRADEWYYCFLQTRTAYVLPMKACREWFLEARAAKALPYRECRIPNDDPEKGKYTTMGHPVPIRLVKEALPSRVGRIELPD